MRTDPPADAWLSRIAGTLVFGAALGLGGLLGGASGAVGGGLVGLAGAVGLVRTRARRWGRRREQLARPFPESWERLLQERYDHYDRLPPELRRRFQDDVRFFVAEKRITGIGVEVTEELRVLVAASAVTLSAGWPDYEWDQLTEVLLYAQDFDRDYAFEEHPGDEDLAGEAHPWGSVILSVPALRESFEDPDDGYHVGIHEFAHLLDVDQTQFDGIPAGLDGAQSAEWVALREKEMERLRRGKSVLDPYGAEDPVEFLAVAVEAFFETPLALRKRHSEVYAILSAYFRQDPAAWDDARGLRL